MSDPAVAEKPKFKAPKTLAEAADRLYTLRQERLALQKQVDSLSAHESFLSEHLINNLPKSNASGIAGKVANARIESKEIPRVEDWPALYAYVMKTAKKNPGVWGLLQRRVSEGTVKELWAEGVKVPGVTRFDVPVVRLSKL